ncbi:primase-helicase family protein [uncultured Sphingomonas sp.]|uniref:primase-helicase family protein n=1 Tax=uncultured Sphingomonas sp. TaxID=158754 RepID=UPI00260795BE|nr:primase-helicase family protein [uncultured Sphingomonas sp.]
MSGNVVRGAFGGEEAPPAYMEEAFSTISSFDGGEPQGGDIDSAPPKKRGRKPRKPPKMSDEGVTFDDFYAYMPAHNYIFAPSREMWPATSVNARLPMVPMRQSDGSPVLDDEGRAKKMKATTWLDQNQPVEQMTWSPAHPMIVENRLISEGGWIERPGCSCFNQYRPPVVKPGNPNDVALWKEHIIRVYPDNADHIINWLAHRVQRPGEKINHAIVLGGNQGVGKDSMLEPVKYAVGPWNVSEVAPSTIMGNYHGFLKSVIMRVSEARDLGEVDRFAFYDHMKTFTAAPPDVLRVNEKYIREHAIFNVTGVIITTNHKTTGIYLPADDRRHYVAWTDLCKEDFSDEYWAELWTWYENGGLENVAAYLQQLDISAFNPKAPPPKTEAFWAIVEANQAPEGAEMSSALEALGHPTAVTVDEVVGKADSGFRIWLTDRKNSRQIPHRFEDCGYVKIKSAATADGFWPVGGARRRVIYAQRNLSIREQAEAASRLSDHLSRQFLAEKARLKEQSRDEWGSR